MDCFSYNAPDFFDFSKGLDSEDAKTAEQFFDVEHESHTGVAVELRQSIDESSERDFECQFYTPMKKTPVKGTTEDRDDEEEIVVIQHNGSNIRRSLSMGNLRANDYQNFGSEEDLISNSMKDLHINKNQIKSTLKCDSTKGRKKSHCMLTRSDVPKLNLRTRAISRDKLDKLAQPKRMYVSQEDLSVQRYVSMAEAMIQFHQKTPKRFHTMSKADENTIIKTTVLLPQTIPHSPALATKQRARPTNVLSREEKEMQEFEEAKKHQIKAHPVNMKILSGPLPMKPPTVAKKQPTKPEPFNLTEMHHKVPTSPAPPSYEFHAKPLPKSILEAPKPIIKNSLCTQPITPLLMKRYHRLDQTKNQVMLETGNAKNKQQPIKPLRTKPLPFSFEERNKEIIKRREKLVNEVLEEERKAREFHARPMPKSILRSPQSTRTTLYYQKRQKSDGSLYKSNENLSNVTLFKAKPAKVLHQKPFEPKRAEQYTKEFVEFQMHSEKRAKEREEFEQKKKEKEEKLAQLIKEKEDEMLRREAEEVERLRKQTEYKAQPIRRYKEVPAVKTKELTDPVSPKFSSKSRNKENIPAYDKENSLNNANTF